MKIKKALLVFLVKHKIIQGRFINPFLLWGFILLTPIVGMIYGQVALYDEQVYGQDQEIIDNILKEYDSYAEIEEIEVAQIPPKKNAETSIKKYVAKDDNLDALMIKVKKNPSSLTNWDRFRLATYKVAISLKNTYPNIDGTPKQIYSWSMKTFYQESKYDPHAKNPHSSARGLFQAMHDTRKALNMPVGLPLNKQVEKYEQYIKMQIEGQKINTSKLNSVGDWYLIVFYPTLADKPDNAVFSKCGGFEKKYCKKRSWKKCNYHANPIYDLNKDGIIYKKEICNHIANNK